MRANKMQHPAKRKTMPPIPAIDTAEALFASGLEGDALAEAFDALSDIEQERFVDDPRRWMACSIDTTFN